MIGYVVANVVFLKEMMPDILEELFGSKLPSWALDQSFWVFLFSYACLLPLCMPRKLRALRLTSTITFILVVYIVVSVVCLCLFNTDINPNLRESMKPPKSNYPFSAGLIYSLPNLIFGFQYHTNIPMIYRELSVHNRKQAMRRVILWGTAVALVLYVLTGFFGLSSFSSHPDLQNVLHKSNLFLVETYRGNNWILAGKFFL